MAATYTTATAVRTELNVDSSTLPDADANKLIADAEDLVDQELGGRLVDATSGRKVVQAQVEAWQWTKLGRATAKLAALLYLRPELGTTREWRNVRGPDFGSSGPVGSVYGPVIVALLNATGLRNTGSVQVATLGGRAWDSVRGN